MLPPLGSRTVGELDARNQCEVNRGPDVRDSPCRSGTWEVFDNDIPGQCGVQSTLQTCGVLSGLDPGAVHTALTLTGASAQHASALQELLNHCRLAVVDVLTHDRSAGGCGDGDAGFWLASDDAAPTTDEDALTFGDIRDLAQWLRLMVRSDCYFDDRAIRILAMLLGHRRMQVVKGIASNMIDDNGHQRLVDVRARSALIRPTAAVQWVRRHHFQSIVHQVCNLFL